MKNYTEPKLEIVTMNVSDVITTSSSFASLFKVSNIEDGARASLNQFQIGNNQSLTRDDASAMQADTLCIFSKSNQRR